MRHRIYGRKLNRDNEHRIAMFRNLAAGLFEHGRIETTLPKAKAVQPFVEKIITIAKRGTFTARRQIEARLNDRMIYAWVADSNVPDEAKDNRYFDLPEASEIEFNRYGEVRKAPRLVQHILTKVAPLFEDRDGGYTRIIRTGRHRLGDGADIVVLELVGREEGPQIGGGTSSRRVQANRRAAFAAQLRKGGVAVEEQPADEDAADSPGLGLGEAAETTETVADPGEEQPASETATDEFTDSSSEKS